MFEYAKLGGNISISEYSKIPALAGAGARSLGPTPMVHRSHKPVSSSTQKPMPTWALARQPLDPNSPGPAWVCQSAPKSKLPCSHARWPVSPYT